MTMTLADRSAVPEGAGPSDSTTLPEFRPGRFHLRNCWFPLAHTQRLRRGPVLRPIHGQPVYLWREQGRLRATNRTPIEIGQGRRRASDLVDEAGNYRLVERYGYAWVWYGAFEEASDDLIPNISHFPVEGLPIHMEGSLVFDGSYELICENLLDFTHADFLHSALTGDPMAEDDEVTVQSTSETVTVTRIARRRRVPPLQRPFVKGDFQDLIYTTMSHVRNGVNLIHAHWQPFASVRMVHAANPESVTRTRTPVTFNVKDCSTIVRHLFPFCSHMVASQDNIALRPQNPRYILGDDRPDMSSRFDQAGLRYRRVFRELVARQMKGDFSYRDDGHPSRDISAELRV